MEIKVLLKEQLEKRGLSQKDLSEATGVRAATIHDLYHNKSKQLPIKAIEKIATELQIVDIRELIILKESNQSDAE
ncbi:transcriptional regulator [Bacillus cereus]|uniref:helix-turn-helix domain-containing protein n=1 Tax=Bacillus TaxID=1386 RepID=UPI000BF31EB5|nr:MULTISPECIES: helix-turn-helix transcriptional regulator [Bacillus cereus group]MDR4152099.1 helix-turn-helix transcriptional regulator [Bacillus cereus]MEB9933815.1 helix-turn-helix transcriptional regulator [Bacillus cereus]MEB9954795.1 helix-turn-helix transcriptional regulator [Bacillus cereus]PER66341.1 transcriptional regulator [Bacillus cereus]PEY10182.1 transcriptional regulator [Bacillus cereus]